MINIKKIITITSVVALSIGTLMAQGSEKYGTGVFGSGLRNGTAGASQLLIPQGAKYLTGGGAVANATGVGAAYWNPAGVARATTGLETTFSNRSYIADMSVVHAGASLKLGANAFAVTVRSIDIGEILSLIHI